VVKNNIFEEQNLVFLIKKKDRAAMRDLYVNHIGFLTALCSRYISSDENVKDILQECFIKIYTSIDKFNYRGVGSLRAWMSKIVVNQSIKFLRSSGKLNWLQYEENLPDAIEEDISIDEIPPNIVHQMIRNLPVGYRMVLNLYVFEEKSHKEIASILNISESTSASQYHRAKAILAKQIKIYKSTL
jgi:RNA polymerase sigma factor, sigma-70 family